MDVLPVTTAWMELQSGLRFNPSDESPSYRLKDMCWGVARICRYAGQIREEFDHYSVAEHQVLMTEWAFRTMYPGYANLGMAALPSHSKKELRTVAMHDAHEGLVGDMTRPMKKLSPDFCAHEGRFERVVARNYDLINPLPGWVKGLDNRILQDERRQAMTPSGNSWASDDLAPLGVELQFWSARTAYHKYVALLKKLGVEEAHAL